MQKPINVIIFAKQQTYFTMNRMIIYISFLLHLFINILCKAKQACYAIYCSTGLAFPYTPATFTINGIIKDSNSDCNDLYLIYTGMPDKTHYPEETIHIKNKAWHSIYLSAYEY